MITLTDNIDYFAFTLAIMATTAVILNLWQKKKWLQGSSLILSAGAAALMLAELIVRTVQSGRIPVNSVYEFLLVFSFVLLAFSVFWLLKIKIQVIAVFILVVATVLLGISFRFSGASAPLMPALQSRWRVVHVLTAIISYSAFTVAFGVALFYVITIPRKVPAGGLPAEKAERALFLEKLMFNFVVVGFIFLTLLIITGSIWAEDAWGAWWSWDPKETWALITWIIYAVYMHLHSKPFWKGHKGCYLSIAGFACVLFTLLGVSFLMGGLHSY